MAVTAWKQKTKKKFHRALIPIKTSQEYFEGNVLDERPVDVGGS